VESEGGSESAKRAAVLCVFCNKPGSLTKEHVIPQWLGKLVRSHDLQALGQAPKTWINGRLVHGEGIEARGDVEIRSLPADILETTVKVVCMSCNSGWMNRIETNVMDAVSGMVLGRPTHLRRGTKQDIATWAVLKAMVYQFTDTTLRPIGDEQLSAMFANALPPEHFAVGLGRYAGHRDIAFKQRTLFGSQNGPELRASTSVMLIGALVIYTIGANDPRVISHVAQGPIGSRLRYIWPEPTGALSWPPSSAQLQSTVDIEMLALELAAMVGGPAALFNTIQAMDRAHSK